MLAHVQLDESDHNRGVTVRVPGLDPLRAYDLVWEGPVPERGTSKSVAPFAVGPTAGQPMTGADLAVRGFWMPRMRPETVSLVRLVSR